MTKSKEALETGLALQKALIKVFVPIAFHCPWMPTNLSLPFTVYSYIDLAWIEPIENDIFSERNHINLVLAYCAPRVPDPFMLNLEHGQQSCIV